MLIPDEEEGEDESSPDTYVSLQNNHGKDDNNINNDTTKKRVFFTHSSSSPSKHQQEFLLFHILQEKLENQKKLRSASKNLLFIALNNEASLAWSQIVTTYINTYSDKWGTWVSIMLLSIICVWACFMFYDVSSALRMQAAERKIKGIANTQTQLVTQGLDSVVDALGFVLAVAWDRATSEALGLKNDANGGGEKWYWRTMYAAATTVCWPFIVVLWNMCVPRVVMVTSAEKRYSNASAERVKRLSSIWLSSGAWIVAFGWLRAIEELSREVVQTTSGTDSDLIRQWVVACIVFLVSLVLWACLRRVNVPPLFSSRVSLWKAVWQRQKGAFVRSSSISCKYVGALAIRYSIQASILNPISVISIVYCCCICVVTVCLTLLFERYSEPISPKQVGVESSSSSSSSASSSSSSSSSSLLEKKTEGVNMKDTSLSIPFISDNPSSIPAATSALNTTTTSIPATSSAISSSSSVPIASTTINTNSPSVPPVRELAEDPLMMSSGFPSTFPQFLLQDFTLLSTYAFDFLLSGYLRSKIDYTSNMWLYAVVMTGIAVLAPKVLTCHRRRLEQESTTELTPSVDPQVLALQLQLEELQRENDVLRSQLALRH